MECYSDFNQTIISLKRSYKYIGNARANILTKFLPEFIKYDGVRMISLYMTYLLQFKDYEGMENSLISSLNNIIEFIIPVIQNIDMIKYFEDIENFYYYFSNLLDRVIFF